MKIYPQITQIHTDYLRMKMGIYPQITQIHTDFFGKYYHSFHNIEPIDGFSVIAVFLFPCSSGISVDIVFTCLSVFSVDFPSTVFIQKNRLLSAIICGNLRIKILPSSGLSGDTPSNPVLSKESAPICDNLR